MRRLLDDEEITRQLRDLPGWSDVVTEGHRALERRWTFAGFADLVAAVVDIADEAEQLDHHPDLDIRYRSLLARLSTHDLGGVSQLDIELAHRMERAARDHGSEDAR